MPMSQVSERRSLKSYRSEGYRLGRAKKNQQPMKGAGFFEADNSLVGQGTVNQLIGFNRIAFKFQGHDLFGFLGI